MKRGSIIILPYVLLSAAVCRIHGILLNNNKTGKRRGRLKFTGKE